MHILNNTDKEFCRCLGPEYAISSPWGVAYCIINYYGECYAPADIPGKRGFHSEEALLESRDRCPKCKGYIYTIIKHP